MALVCFNFFYILVLYVFSLFTTAAVSGAELVIHKVDCLPAKDHKLLSEIPLDHGYEIRSFANEFG